MKKVLLVLAAVPLVVIASALLWAVSKNGGGRRLAAINSQSEPVALVWRGAWSEEARYAPGEVVSFEGSSYVAETETAQVRPDPRECGERCPWATLGGAGAAGPEGPAGPAGPQGPAGISGYVIVRDSMTIQPGARARKVISCPSGKKVFGGGWATQDLDQIQSRPLEPNENGGQYGWEILAHNLNPNATLTFTVEAVCATAS
jgi:hypothetical protein